MEEQLIRDRLYEKYIAPTRKEKHKDYIGIEIEMPIVNLRKKPVDFNVVHEITRQFMEHFSFQAEGKDEEGNIYSAVDHVTGDILSYDCSYNNLELSLGKEKELGVLNKRFRTYYSFLKGEFEKRDHTLTGMGINPYRMYNQNIPIPNGRYRMLFHHLHSYKNYELPMYFHSYPEYGTFSSASQVQMDVSYEDLLVTLEAFSRLEPVKALLFSNSVLLGEHEELLCFRDCFWENSTHGINPHNIGMFDCEFHDVEELLSYIASTSIYCVERDEKYINFPPVPIIEYFQKPWVTGEYYEDGTYHTIKVVPRIEDISYLRTFKFEDLTFRGTVEFRSVCCQPVKDSMTVAAFHVGLKEELDSLYHLLKEDHVIYRHGYTASELRKMFVKKELPGFVNQEKLYGLVKEILDLANKGLVSRGYGEEIFLKPLYRRLDERTNPARKLLELRDQGISLENLIWQYGQF
ncbi:MAG: glutamylcysteine synthetase [Clostridiales bacterium]|nr:glutamylcysteine synthetase [Clostridiales bacterium]